MTWLKLGLVMLTELFKMGQEIVQAMDSPESTLTPEQIRAERQRVFNEARIDEAIENRMLQRAQADAQKDHDQR